MMPLYAVVRGLVGSMVYMTNGFQVEGAENIPRTGAAILVANHVSEWDPFVLGAAVPRQVFFMAKKELFEAKIMAGLLKRVGAFKVNRGQADREAIREASGLLSTGNLVGIFVEGTRNRTAQDFLPPQPGAAMLALRTGAPIIPMALINTSQVLKKLRQPVIVRIGTALSGFTSDGRARNSYAEVSAAIMENIARLYGR